ncbi:stage V sporulation protein AC [Bhargavaea beijingensis]|uniref:Stage V sporulation protein AC n=1 Tax=Bhargavaea beijingensis TaxID=426756 RepID=A0A1G7BPS7_9BACL|nr:stage V sporulation protein AC [Bhargavaea beijingensis]MCW1926742.1 stage V sporulation protein AC [Bhargavaea beijingensis]RSK37005.1 stage V sporulation protein AC [Bhargavaea beijingensis]SDE28967.1 stage V sporulation protein AC [Bhargavaea beijingensis]
MDRQAYSQMEQQVTPKVPLGLNLMKAFLTGGIICAIGEGVMYFYMYFFDFTERTAGNPTVATMIFIAMLLTGFGKYKRIAQFGGAGSAVPVTGFGNAMISAAIEHRTEGYVLGVGGNMFKLAGSVIVFGVFSAFVVALIKTILVKFGVVGW